MKKILLLLFLSMLVTSVAFAEITKEYDQFDNIYRVRSIRKGEIPDRDAELMFIFSKTYNLGNSLYYDKKTKKYKETYSISFSVISKNYWFFRDSFDYLIEGDTRGYSQALKTLSNRGDGFVSTSGFGYPRDRMLDAIKENKIIAIRLNFKDELPFIFQTAPETLEEWNEVIDFDLNEELKKE